MLNEGISQQSDHFNQNIAQSAQNQQQMYDALTEVIEGVATLNNEVNVNRDQLLVAEKLDEEAEKEFNRINQVMTTHEQELHKHVHNFNTVEKTFNQWQ
jgi:GTPase involved in cell partitioning and DNA repair